MKPGPLPVTLLINTRNEQDSIVAAIESCRAWVSEVVVVDMESSDRTVELARECGATIVSVPAAGVVEPGRQAGLDAATQPWVFVLDADERPADGLPEQVARAVERSDLAGLCFARENHFMGRRMRHSNLWPDWQLRLLRRAGANWPPYVHTRVELDGPVEHAPKRRDCAIVHQPDRTISEDARVMERYATFEVDRYLAIGRKPSVLRILLAPVARFAETLLLHRGFLDGIPGLTRAWLMASYAALVETKLWERVKVRR